MLTILIKRCKLGQRSYSKERRPDQEKSEQDSGVKSISISLAHSFSLASLCVKTLAANSKARECGRNGDHEVT